ncbi:MAG: chromosomal replication initiator protein DnaA [Proteobacteria bacterium]|nr:chromosomal replication initiator protein DnaA [Pseudomonadota bacterium]
MESVWAEVKTLIKDQIPGHSFRMWIDPIVFNRGDEANIFLSCPNYFSKKRVEDQYSTLIENEIRKLTGTGWGLVLEVSARRALSDRSMTAVSPIPCPKQMVLPMIGHPVMHTGRMLRENYTFDEFVVGSNNDFAYSAALSLAMADHSRNNTLFLISGTGMGKSHLSQAIGHYITKKKPSERVYYITAEDFTNEMIGSIKNKTADHFKAKYRNQCDVLLLEDIHFLTGKEHTQIELSMTLDHLSESGKKIMFSSCYLPSDIPKMNDQLKSRFSSSVISNIEAPDFKTRLKILRKKAQRENYHVPDHIIEYLAGELTDDVRQLESGLVGVIAKSSLLGVPIDYELAESVVRNISVKKKMITIDLIKNTVSNEYGITVGEMVSKSRRQAVVRPRQIAIYLSRKFTDQTLQSIGKSFNRYHATAMHAVGCVEKSMREEVAVKKHIEYIAKKLEAGTIK